MSKIFLYGLSLVLLFNNAYTMQYNDNNRQLNLDNTQLINQPVYTKNKIIQQDTVTTPKVQQNINMKNKNNNTTLEQTAGLILNKLSNLEKAVGVIREQIYDLTKEQKKVNKKIEQQQEENDALIQQALDDFHSSQARTLITQDGNGKIITESDIDPDKLSQYSQEKPPHDTSTVIKQNVLSPSMPIQ